MLNLTNFKKGFLKFLQDLRVTTSTCILPKATVKKKLN